MRGKVSMELCWCVQREVGEVEAGCDGASHECATPERTGCLHDSGGHDGLREMTIEDLVAEGDHPVFGILEEMKFERGPGIVMPLLIRLNDVPGAECAFGQQKVDRSASGSLSSTGSHLLG